MWRAMYPETAADTADYLRPARTQRLVRPSRLELWVARADGSEPGRSPGSARRASPRTSTPTGGGSSSPRNHPDPRSRNFDLYLVNLDGSGLERVTTSPEFDAFPMFSPDGKRLVFASNRNAAQPGETNIFIADWAE